MTLDSFDSSSCLDWDVSTRKRFSFSSSVKFDGVTKCRKGVEPFVGKLFSMFWTEKPLEMWRVSIGSGSSLDKKSRISSEFSSWMSPSEIWDEIQVSLTLVDSSEACWQHLLIFWPFKLAESSGDFGESPVLNWNKIKTAITF